MYMIAIRGDGVLYNLRDERSMIFEKFIYKFEDAISQLVIVHKSVTLEWGLSCKQLC